MRRVCAFLGAFFLVWGLPPPSAHAVVVFDTIGPTGVTTGGSGVFVGTSSGINYERTASFVVPGSDDYYLTGIDLLLDAGGETIRLWSDAPGQPGTLLDSAVAPGSPLVNDLFRVDFGGTALLDAGQTYWISVSLASGSSAWRYTSVGPYVNGNRMNRENGGPWQDSSPRFGPIYGVTVLGTMVPEPGTLGLLASGLAGLAACRSGRARQSVKKSMSSASRARASR
jgi:hypothetical protein